MKNFEKIKITVKEIQNLFYVKRYKLIISKCKIAIKKYPEISIFYNLLGLALTKINKPHEAIAILQRGFEINKNDIAIINNLANAYKNTYNYKDAEKLYKLSISKKSDYFNAYVNYGNLKRDLNQLDEAIELYKKSLNLNKELPEIYYLISMAYQSIGNFKNAEIYANKALSIKKNFTKVDLLKSKSLKYDANNEHFVEMKSKIKKNKLNVDEQIDLNFALAKAYEDQKNIENCYQHLEIGNKLFRNKINYNLKNDENIFNKIKDIFTDMKLDNSLQKYKDSKNIIFIVGMPRSGTTLTEQIISAHPDVYGSGELPYLKEIINNEIIENEFLDTKKTLKLLNNNEFVSKLSERYFEYIKNYEINSEFLTDKAPLNFMWIGFIKILFKNAKIIHCKRDSKDNCVSLYKNVFEGGLNFCYDQVELARYYLLYEDLMKFWEKTFPEAFLTINYEELIQNPEKYIREILSYCKLDWNEKCLNFSENRNPIKTASVGQARQSIYSTSFRSYKKFEPYLKDLFETLQKKSPSELGLFNKN